MSRRKRKIISKTDSGAILNFFKPSGEDTAASIANGIIRGLLDSVIKTPEQNTRKHHVSASDKTLKLWQAEFPWMITEHSRSEMKMKCEVCIKKKLPSLWSLEGSNNFQKTGLSRHASSTEHLSALTAISTAPTCSSAQDPSSDESDPNHTESDESKLFRTVFYAAKEGLATNQVNNLLELQRLNGACIKYKNLSWDTLTDIQTSMRLCQQKEIVSTIIQDSEFFSVMLDESTDMKVEKHLSICVRFASNGEQITKFLTNLPIENGKAHTIVGHLVATLENFGLNPVNMISLATDGAATMIGHKTGVGVQMKSKYSPFMVQTHCMAHRLNLAFTDSIKKNDDLKQFREKFNSLYHFVSGSSSRVLTLKKMQHLLEEPDLSIKEPYSIRWMGLKIAVEAVYYSYESVLATLSSFASENNAQAKGLLKYFLRYKTVMMVAFLLDFHEIIGALSLSLQRDDFSFGELEPLLDGTVERLEDIKSNDGTGVSDMKKCVKITEEEERKTASLGSEKLTHYSEQAEIQLKIARDSYITSLQKNIKNRFPKQDGHIFRSLSTLLDPAVFKSSEETEVQEALSHISSVYGEEKVTKIYIDDNTEETRVQPLIDKEKIKQEWPMLKGMLKGAYKNKKVKALCKRVITVHRNEMPEMVKICKIAMSIVVTSVVCERSFSYQNRIKNKYRSSLKDESLDNVMQIQMSDLDLSNYDPSKAISHWNRQKRKRKSRLCQEYKPRMQSDKLSKC